MKVILRMNNGIELKINFVGEEVVVVKKLKTYSIVRVLQL